MSSIARQDTLTIDPVAMNVVNRVAAGTQLDGQLRFSGGVLVQGRLGGDAWIQGPLIIWGKGEVTGRVRVMGDLYLFGQLGAADGAVHDTVIECHGVAYVASTAVATGTLVAASMQMYDGADLRGAFRTLRDLEKVPTLNEPLAPQGGSDPTA